MAIVALGSVKASPGATTATLALAAVWPEGRHLLLVDADPDGGDLAARVGLRVEPGMASLAAAGRRSLTRNDLDGHLQQIAGGVPVLVGNPDPEQAARELGVVSERLAAVLPSEQPDVLVDCGRFRSSSPAAPLANRADLILLACRPRIDELQHVRACARRLLDGGRPVALILVGDDPYPPEDVASAIECPVLGVLAQDERAAASLAGRGGRAAALARSALIRSARSLSESIVSAIEGQDRPGPHGSSDLVASGADAVASFSSRSGLTDGPWSSKVAGNGSHS